jgi:hypothetical protein
MEKTLTQQQAPIKASDIANAIMQSVIESQKMQVYLAAVLKELGGDQTASVSTLEALQNGPDWTITAEPVGDDKVQFKLVEAGKGMGRLIVPS